MSDSAAPQRAASEAPTDKERTPPRPYQELLRTVLAALESPALEIRHALDMGEEALIAFEEEVRALSERDRADRGPPGVSRAEGRAHHREHVPVSRARGVRRERREVLLRPQQRDPDGPRAARGVAAARRDRSVGRRQVVVRARRPRARRSRERR